jgi:type IV pilus assembly protein PilQ
MNASEFKATLTALNTLSNSKVISNPTIVTLNNTEASINVGEEYPIPNYTYNQEQGSFEVSGFNYKPLGVLLKVTPQVNARGFIKLTLEPEVSARGSDAVTFGTASIPVINTRKTKTQISMKDGYTMGIGGLLSKSDLNGSTKVPILGSIPIIGNLFKSKSKENSMKNLLIFITAKIVNAEGAAANEVFDPEQIRLGDVHERDLPGYRQKGNIFVPPEAPKKKNALRDELP